MGKIFFKKILVAVNGTENSLHAAMYAIMMAKTYDLELKVVHVVDSATIKYLGMNQILLKEEQKSFHTDLTNEGQNNLDYIEMLASTKGVQIKKELRQGAVFTEIIKCSQEFNADLILVGGLIKDLKNDYGRKNADFFLHREILNHAKCPVMVVQKADIEAEFKIF